MERFFLFCFRSCLKGENDREYYDVLEIDNPNTATIDLIKKQYKKLSLSVHPDKLAQKGVEVTAEHKQKFLKIKEAYDVLSDPKRKKLYDQLGASGLKLMENPTEVDPMTILRNYQKNHKDRTMVVLLVGILFAAVLILPILFSLKCDGTLGDNAKWVAIWTPMWVVDFMQIIAAVAILLDNSEPAPKTEEDEAEPEPKIPLSDKLYNFFSTVLFTLIQIFVLIRLDEYVEWSWFKVFIPWFLYEFLQAAANVPLAFLTTIEKPDYDNMSLMLEEGQNGEEEMFMLKIDMESRYFEKIMEQKDAQRAIYVHALRFWLAIFLALKLDHDVSWNWGLVMLPIWTYLALQYVYSFAYASWGRKKQAGLDGEAIERGEEKDPIKMVNFQQGGQLSATSTFLCLSQAVPLFMALLLISRLEVSHITTFVIILPVFIGIGCCCCGVFCAICMLSCVDMDDLEKQMRGEGQEGQEEGNYAPPEGGGDVENNGGDGSQGSADSTSPFQLESSTSSASAARSAPAPAPAPVVHAAPEQIEVDID